MESASAINIEATVFRRTQEHIIADKTKRKYPNADSDDLAATIFFDRPGIHLNCHARNPQCYSSSSAPSDKHVALFLHFRLVGIFFFDSTPKTYFIFIEENNIYTR